MLSLGEGLGVSVCGGEIGVEGWDGWKDGWGGRIDGRKDGWGGTGDGMEGSMGWKEG